MRTLLPKLKRALFPSQQTLYALKQLESQLLLEMKSKRVMEKPLVRAHVDNLSRTADAIPEDRPTGYATELLARKICPRIMMAENADLKRPTVAMVCVGKEFAGEVEAGVRSIEAYCQAHGYHFAMLEEMPYRYDRAPAWLKIPLLLHLLEKGHERIFYLDADVLITNPAVKLEDSFDRLDASGRAMLIAEDVYSLNTGAFFLRQSWQARSLLDLIYEWEMELDHGSWEQQALLGLVERYPAVRAQLLVETEARRFNAMPFDGPRRPNLPADCSRYAWQAGDFLCHFAGSRDTKVLGAKMRRLYSQLNNPGK
jgi:hypothetical protein